MANSATTPLGRQAAPLVFLGTEHALDNTGNSVTPLAASRFGPYVAFEDTTQQDSSSTPQRKVVGLPEEVLANATFPTPELAMRGAKLRRQKRTMGDLIRSKTNKDLLRGTRMRTSLKSAVFAVLMLVRMQMAIDAKRKLLKAQNQRSRANSMHNSRRGSMSMSRHSANAFLAGPSAGPPSIEEAAVNRTVNLADGSALADDDRLDACSNVSFNSVSFKHNQDGDGEDHGIHLGSLGTGRFFPTPKDLEQYPPLIVQHIHNAAARCLARCLHMVRVRRVLNFHKSQRKRLGPEAIPPACIVGTCFEGWPKDAMATLLNTGYAERRSAGEFLYYEGEVTTTVTFVLDGTISFLHRKNGDDKRLNASKNASVAARPSPPVILRESSVFVEEADDCAVQVHSLTDTIVVTVDAVKEVFNSLPSAVKDTILRRCYEKRQELSRSRDDMPEVLRWSPLFNCVSDEKANIIGQVLEPRSYVKGSTIFDREKDGHEVMFFVSRGAMHGVTTYRTQRGTWEDLVFAKWQRGDTIGEKSLYFGEDQLFSLAAATNIDLWILKRAKLMQLMVADRALKQEVSDGAFSVRCKDPSVRMILSTTRNIPCIKYAVSHGIMTEAQVREVHALFEFAIFPANELITSTSDMVRSILVLMTGTAVANALDTDAFVVPSGLALGVGGLNPMRWRYPTQAATPCEGWRLPIDRLLAYFDGLGIRETMCRIAKQLFDQAMRGVEADRVMTVETPLQLFSRPKPMKVMKKVHRNKFYTEDAGIHFPKQKPPQTTTASRHGSLHRTATGSSSNTSTSASRHSMFSSPSLRTAGDASGTNLRQGGSPPFGSYSMESFADGTKVNVPQRNSHPRRSSVIDLDNVDTVDADDEGILSASPRKSRARRLSGFGSSGVDASQRGSVSSRRTIVSIPPDDLPSSLTPDPEMEHSRARRKTQAPTTGDEDVPFAPTEQEPVDVAAVVSTVRPSTASSVGAKRNERLSRTIVKHAFKMETERRKPKKGPNVVRQAKTVQNESTAVVLNRLEGHTLRFGNMDMRRLSSPYSNMGSLRGRMLNTIQTSQQHKNVERRQTLSEDTLENQTLRQLPPRPSSGSVAPTPTGSDDQRPPVTQYPPLKLRPRTAPRLL